VSGITGRSLQRRYSRYVKSALAAAGRQRRKKGSNTMWVWTAFGYQFVPAYAPVVLYPPAPLPYYIW
jgi:hypothetical protein